MVRQGRINWNLIIVLFIAVIAVAITAVGLRKYHRSQRADLGLNEGLKAYEQQRWMDAASCLGQYLAVHPDDVEILNKYAQSHLRIQPFKHDSLSQAINAYRNVLRLEDNAETADALVGLYLQNGMPAEAELIARRFTDPDEDGRFRRNLATALMGQRKFEQAFDVLTKLVDQKPDQVIAYNLLSAIAEQRPAISSVLAQEWLDRAIQQNPKSAQAYIYLALFHTSHQQYADATEDIAKAEQCDLSDVETRLMLAAFWIRRGQIDSAVTQLDQIEKTDPANSTLWQLRATIARQQDDAAQLVKVADDGLAALGANNFNFLTTATDLYIQANQLERAEQCLKLLTDTGAERATLLYLEGFLAKARNEWTDAIQKWQQSIQLGNQSETVYLNLAETLDRINNRSMAIQLLRRYTSQNENAFRVHLRLSQLFAKDQNWAEAMEQATAAVQLNPASLPSRIHYLYCRIELLDPQKKVDVDVLEKNIEEVIRIADSADTRMLLCQLAVKLQDYARAEEILNTTRKTFGDNEQLAVTQGRIQLLQGRQDEAVALLKQSLETYPQPTQLVQLLVWGYVQQLQYDPALAVLQSLLETESDAFVRRQYQLWQAEVLMLADRRSEAIALYRRMAESNQSDIFARRQLLASHESTDDPAQRQQWVDDIKAAEGPDGWQWKYEQVRLWFGDEEDFQRHYAESVKLLTENLGINAEDQSSRLLLASCHERAGNVQLALSMYQDATPRQARNLEFIVAAVGAMYRAKEYRQAQQMLTQATEQGLWDPRLARYELQNTLRTGSSSDAVSLLEKMIAESPADDNAKMSLAILLIRNDQFDEARQMIQGILDKQPDLPLAMTAMVELEIRQKRFREALEICDAHIKAHDSLTGYVARIRVLLAAGDPQRAQQDVETVASKFADDFKALLVAADFYQMLGQMDKAAVILNKLLATEGDQFAVQKQAALFFLAQTDPSLQEKGRDLLQQALQKNPEDVQLKMQQVRLLVRKQNAESVAQARKILSGLVEIYPKQEEAWAMMAQIALLEQNRQEAMDVVLRGLTSLPDSRELKLLKARIESEDAPELALKILEALYREAPDDPSVVLMLSENYRKTGQLPKTVLLLEEALKQESLKESIPLTNELIAACYELGNKERAEAMYHALIQRSGDPAVFLNRLNLLSQDGSPKDIQAAYTEWTRRHPDNAGNILAAVLGKLVRMAQPEAVSVADGIIQAVIVERPESPVGYQAKATLLHMTGQKADAVPWYEKTIALAPDQVIAINNLAWILCTEKKDYPKAMACAEKGLAIAPDYVDLIDTRGVIYMHLEQYDKAIEDFKRSEALYFAANPNRTLSVFHQGQCLLKLQQPSQALIKLLEAKDLYALNRGLTPEQYQRLEALIEQASTLK